LRCQNSFQHRHLDGLLEQQPSHAILEYAQPPFDGGRNGGGQQRIILVGGQIAEAKLDCLDDKFIDAGGIVRGVC